MQFTTKLALALIAAVAIGLTGCGKKSPKARYTVSDFEHPSPELLRDIARKEGWKIEDVEAQQRAFDALGSNQQPSDADWQRLVKAADYETNDFALELMTEFSRHMTDKYRAPVLKWCERYMEQTNDAYAAVLSYDCYVRSGGSNAESWASRLKVRGRFYVEKIDLYDKRAAARKQ